MTSRIAIKDDIKKIKKIKSDNKLFDSIFAISNIDRGKKRLEALIVKATLFFNQIEKILKLNNVKIKKLSPVKPFWKGKNLYLFSRGKKMGFDKIIWTGNPTALIKVWITQTRLEKVNMKIFCGDLKTEINDCFIYRYSH